MKKLYILIGIPGSGKSTWMSIHVAKYYDPSDTYTINMDSIREELTGDVTNQTRNAEVARLAQCRFCDAIGRGVECVIWDNTTVSRKYRKDLISGGQQAGYEVIGVFFNVTLAEAKRRNQARDRKVPEFVLDKMFSQLQPPTLDEGFSEIITI